MRVKYILNQLSIGEKLKIVYERITFTRYTTVFVFVALAHCLVQIALQATAYSFNTTASRTLDHVIQDSDVQLQYAFVKSGVLYVCSGVPTDGDPFDSVCWAFAGPGVAPPNSTLKEMHGGHEMDVDAIKLASRPRFGLAYAPALKTKTSHTRRHLGVVPRRNSSGGLLGANITGLNESNPEDVTQLSTRCIKALNWPSIVLHDSRREDISFLFFQIWLLGISVVTILNESIPHLVAGLVTHGMSTAWGAFQVSRTGGYRFAFETLVVNDACNGVDVIPGFWSLRLRFFVPILVLNVVALVISLGVSMKLINVYARQTFNRVGASRQMNILYIYVLLFSVFLQLSAFFTICGSALWIDALSNGVLKGKTLYKVIFTIACIVEFPWVITGWLSIRREHHIWSLVFLIVGLAITAAWTSMFANILYKWSFQNFPFFATLTVTAFIVLIITLVLALICRMHFGKGLPQYLKTEEVFDDSSFIPVVVSKKRQSRLVSVIFPDKRADQVRKNSDEKKAFTLNPYRQREDTGQRPESYDSVIDIKAPSLQWTDSESHISSNAAADGHGPIESLIARAKAPFLRFSDGSRLGRASSRFSVFTSSSSSTDLEHGVPDVPAMPTQVLKLPTQTSNPVVAPVVPVPVKLTMTVSRTSSLSMSSRASHLPTLNVIPASLPLSHTIVEQGDLHVRAASESSIAESVFTERDIVSSRSRRLSETQQRPALLTSVSSQRALRYGNASVGLPRNPRPSRG